MKYEHKKLANGLNVFLVNMPDAQSVLFTITAKVGSRNEVKKFAGISHFLEHVFFKGSINYPSPTAISEIVDAIGGDFNAATSKEGTEFYIKSEKHHFDLIFDVLTDMLLTPLFPENELEKEKGVVIEEINMYQDSPSSVAESKLEELIWPNTALGRDIIGTKQTVLSLKRKDLLAYRENFYKPNNLIIGISGNFNQKHALKKISKTWGKLKSGRIPKTETPKQSQKTPRVIITHKATEQAHLALGFKSYGYGHKNNPASLLLAVLLGGNMSSRLFSNIREQKGLAYYISAHQNPYKGTGNFMIQAGVRIDKFDLAISEILNELRRISVEKVSQAELKRAKDFLKGKIALSFESKHKRIDWIIDQFANTEKIKTPEEFLKSIDKVSAAQVQKVAREIFRNEKVSLSVVGPITNKKSIKIKI